MANNKFVVQYLIKAKDLFSRNANKAAKALGGLDKKAKKAAVSFALFGKKFAASSKKVLTSAKALKVAKNAIKAVGAASIAAVGAMLKVGSSFQTSFTDLRAITGAAGEDLVLLRKRSLELARSTITSQSDVANAIKLVASAKPELLKNIPALIAMTKEILLLKNAGTDVETATKAVAGSLNVFGKSAEFANKFVNILAAGSKFGGSEITDTAEALKIAAPNAVAAGLSFLQLNAAIQAVALGNIKGSQAGTALSAIFGRLRRQGFNIQKLGLPETFLKIRNELEAIKDPTRRALREAKLFGDEHSKVGLALIKNAELLGQLEKAMAGTKVASEQAALRNATFAKQLELIGIIIKGPLIKAFDKLTPILTKMAEDAGKFFDKISDDDIQIFVDGVKNALDIAIQFGKILGSIVKMISSLANNPIVEAISSFGRLQLDVAGGAASSIIDLFSGGDEEKAPAQAKGRGAIKFAKNESQKEAIDINMNVGLDKGLKQAEQPQVNRKQRRGNVGSNLAIAGAS